ncbi:hypothetical protein CPAST_c23860 [Clostridium pasteurianum DSM 525 = ATCC 6013]|uniref:DUF4153 domain-containing protein n=2 Tax=Clostridium pasteurianum TaxID=1501 RepID=A0A0H3J3G0_CLOPA|nr:DUF4153 domain-containing protein [Clostridium pasteurianum]AJA48456.1 hypothetical protein CPAST_c23860 [Clostridium pasteurianum DSM 525 = ATCC 6013]AJA52444.1 hypothetical protein CLPA_c23860 [Clostridium pasteurianum DSM 525 = ATCC 6013]AOZ75698.1 hypothetical protein AQ983_11600 [Clostridium pasteurianum DSM 525 = ATCC 6013]AOZ79494.1 hypothetical protein AQ984_11595 [Clostridium pasteurianum]ELP60395.1 hypothetical protein F502_02882 [Clostridium pasteurianum DSM 525 = ATCC 6013]
MKLKFQELFRALYKKIFFSIKRFPITLIIILITSIILIYYNHSYKFVSSENRELIKRFAMISSLGIPISLCVKMFFERKSKINILIKVVIYIASFTPLIYFYYLFKQGDMISITSYIAFTIAFYIIFTIVPYFYRRDNYEMYIVKLFTNFFITYLYSLILYGGLSAIIFTTDKLFNININGNIYIDILILVICIFAPVYFLSSIPKYNETVTSYSYPKVLSVLIIYIIIPIIIIYSIIMYAFFVKIIITGEWPNNLISHLVLWYSLIDVWIILFIYPLQKINKFTKNFTLWFPRIIIPIMIMMFIAIAIRINSYGITESRYFVVLAGIWVFINMVYIGFYKNSKRLFITLSLAIFSLISVLGPFSSYKLSIYSQNNRFKKILEKNHMITEYNTVKPASSISKNDILDLTSIIYYFNNNHKLTDLNYIPEKFGIDNIEDVFGFKPDYYVPGNDINNISYTLNGNEIVFPIGEYEYFIEYNNYIVKDNSIKIKDRDITITYNRNDSELKIIKKSEQVYKIYINDIVHRINEKNRGKDISSIDDMTFMDENNKIKIKLIFKNIYGTINDDKIQSLETNFYTFISIK